MKKVLIGLLVVVVLIGGGAYYVFSNLDELVKTAIETAGSEAAGVPVRVESVELNLPAGTASIFGFSMANPEGFSDASMVSFQELSVALDINNLSQELIKINSIVARNPTVSYESGDEKSNLDVMSERFSSGEAAPAEAETNGAANAPTLAIGSILIEQIEASIQHNMLPNGLNVNLGDIKLENLEGKPEEIAEQVMGPVISQLSKSAGSALLANLTDMDLGEVEDMAKARVEEELSGLEDKATEALDEALGEGVGDSLKEGLGNLLGR